MKLLDDGAEKVGMDNLTAGEKRGLKSLKKVKEGSLLISQTDKSGRFCVMDREQYRMPEQHPELWAGLLPDNPPGQRPQDMDSGSTGQACDGRQCWHWCRKYFTFWECDETFRKFLPKVQLSGVSRSKKRLNMPENILNM